ncbi:MAG: barstar family protein [Candidatus Pristimantibacillus lignocellulolyticus]|uniref:Barstar family protein n=1 Tax=Candidatus Pristimantibacillus lignocellulolyticus TaxID=2994561 RepID=A0A9J6ZG10_9BACL|nr:MAG: barstar family protein [Candidatus Pristimantibacillus lignocellulolyticus]
MSDIIELRLSEAETYDDVHEWLAAKLDLPATYGRNLDALWDCLTGYINLPVSLLWINDNESTKDYTAIIELFEEASSECDQLSFEYLVNDKDE